MTFKIKVNDSVFAILFDTGAQDTVMVYAWEEDKSCIWKSMRSLSRLGTEIGLQGKEKI